MTLDLQTSAAATTPSTSMRPGAPVVVMKFGSSVLVSPEDAPKVASDIYAEVRKGRRVVAVVSAFSGETDRLLQEARALGLAHDNSLAPAYVVQGEERAAALVALACDRIGLEAETLTVRELGMMAEGPPEHARPTAFRPSALDAALARSEVVVVPGYGALSPEGKVVLLGRGGSDLTAVFLAAELGLDGLQLIKDVDGLYDRDPNTNLDALRYDHASWMEAKALGGGLVQPDALDMAEARRIVLEVRNYLDGHRTVIGKRRQPPRAALVHSPLRIAVAGCGVVGGGALSRLVADPRVEVVGVLVRDTAKPRDVPGVTVERLRPLLTASAETLFDRRPDLLIEALSEPDVGEALVRAALSREIDVVSASKQVVSRDPGGLLDLATEKGRRILWSAAVGGGTPMIETLRDARAQGEVVGFEAVLNGTVNFILERLDAGESFDQALREAGAAGFAEEDPSADLEALDAAAKVRLLAFEAFGEMPAMGGLRRDRLGRGKRPSPGTRQISRGEVRDGEVWGEVRLVETTDPLFRGLRAERNALKVTLADGRVFERRGRGAGRWATAEAVLADVAEIAAARLAD